MHRRQIVDYASLAVVWGLSFTLVLSTVRAFGFVGAVAFRALIACAILALIAMATRRRLSFSVGWWPLAVVGATTVAAQLLGLSYAAPRIGTALAAIFVGTIPLFSMVIGHLWGIERITPAGRVGLVMGFGGILLLVGFPAVPVTPEFALGCVAAVVGAVAAAYGSNYARRRLGSISSWEQSIGAFFFGGLLTLPLVLAVPVPTQPSAFDLVNLLLLAGLCSSLAYVLYFRLVAEVGATLAISVEFVVTAIAVGVGALILGERLTLVQLLGGAVIVAGCALVLGLLPGRIGREAAAGTADAPAGIGVEGP